MDNYKLGVGLSFLSLSFFVCADVMVKILSENSFSASELVFICAVVNFIFLSLIMKRDEWQSLKRFALNKTVLIVFVAGLNTMGGFSATKAFALLPIPDIYILIFTTPIVTFFTAKTILKETVPLSRWLIALACFCGVCIAYYGDIKFTGEALNPVGLMWVGVLILSFALTTTTLRYISLPAKIMSIIPSIFVLVVFPIVADINFELLFSNSIRFWYFVVPLVISSSIGKYFRCESCRLAPASLVGVTHYFQLPIGVVAGYFIWNHLPSPAMILGAIIIISCGLLLLKYNK